MHRILGAAISVAMITAVFGAPAFAGVSQDAGAKFALHAKNHAVKAATVCTTDSPNASSTACSAYVTTWPLATGTDVYLVLANGDSSGFGGATFGIQFDNTPGVGVDMVGWTACVSGLEFPSDNWPQSQSGNVVTYLLPGGCQQTFIGGEGVHAVVGAFYLYAYGNDIFSITEHRVLQSNEKLVTANCSGATTVYPQSQWATRTGKVGFGPNNPGCNPCLQFCGTPVEPTTWGKVKNQYLPGS